MATELDRLVVRIDADLKPLRRELVRSEQTMKRSSRSMSRAFSKLGATIAAVTRKMGGLRGILIALAGGLVGRAFVKATVRQEQALKAVESAIKTTGGSAGLTTKELAKMAAGFQQVTTFGDEFVLEVSRQLLAFRNISKDVFEDSLRAILDFSAATGRNATGAVRTLGLAINDPVAGLGRLSQAGVALTSTQKDLIKGLVEAGDVLGAQRLLIKELEKSYGGAARAARDTLGGSLSALNNAFGDLLESDSLSGVKVEIEELIKLLQAPGTVSAFSVIGDGLALIVQGSAAFVRDLASVINDLKTALETFDRFAVRLDDSVLKALGLRSRTAVTIPLPPPLSLPREIAPPPEIVPLGGIPTTKLDEIRKKTNEIRDNRRGQEASQAALNRQLDQEAEKLRLIASFGGRETEEFRVQTRLLDIKNRLGETNLKIGEAAADNAEKTIRSLEAQRTKLEEIIKTNQELMDEGDKIRDAARDLGLTFSSAFEDAAIAGGDFRSILKGIVDDIQRIIIRLLVTEPIAARIRDIFNDTGAGGSSGGGGGFLGKILGIAGSFFGGFGGGFAGPAGGPQAGVGGGVFPGGLHSGGVVGRNRSFTRNVSPAVFTGAPHFASGGVAGLKSNEVPAILHRGETVRTRGQEAALDRGRGGNISMTQILNISPGVPEAVRREINAMRPALRRDAVSAVLQARRLIPGF